MMSGVLVVGLTGGIGAGKSTVAAMLAARGAHAIDVDALGRAVIAPGGRATDAVVAEFGPGVRGADGGVDRSALAALVFADPDALARHLAIVHPAIDEEIRAALAVLPDDAVAVLDMAVLAESRLGHGQYTTVVVVEAPAEVRVERAVARGMGADDVRARMANQASDADRRALADAVIVNDGDRAALEDQVDAWWRRVAATTPATMTQTPRDPTPPRGSRR
jgi:dephospho-CoA kinase